MSFRVDPDIPFGNACDIHVEAREEATAVHFAADPHGGPESLWFCFRIVRESDAPLPKRFQLVLDHSQNMLGANRPETLRPVIRHEGGDWERLGPGTAQPLPDGRLSIIWETIAPEASLDVAFCYPYGDEDLSSLVEDLGPPWRFDTIGVSQLGRPLRRLSNCPGEAPGTRPGFYFVARQHSGESPGSWVLDGVLRQLSEMGDKGPLVWAVPNANPDGVMAGDYGKDNFPYDLNRAWGSPPMRHETLVMRRDCVLWSERCRPTLCLDFHAPGASESAGCYFFLPEPDAFPQQHAEAEKWSDALAASMGEELMSDPAGRVASYRSRWETPSFTQFVCEQLNMCGMTLETPYAVVRDLVLTREMYVETGRRLASGLAEALK